VIATHDRLVLQQLPGRRFALDAGQLTCASAAVPV
jgi:hypothetical protein